jgi:hypothetical protein
MPVSVPLVEAVNFMPNSIGAFSWKPAPLGPSLAWNNDWPTGPSSTVRLTSPWSVPPRPSESV